MRTCVLLLCVSICGCKMAPLQIVPQPREVSIAPAELPRVPPPNAIAAQVPAGYRVDVVLAGLTYPSSVEFDDSGNMYVAEAGYVYGDEAAPTRILRVNTAGVIEPMAQDLNAPITDLLWHQGKLFISHRGKVSVLENGRVTDIVTDLPSQGDHFNNQLAIGPDGKIYIGQGTASNSGIVGVDNYAFGWLGKNPNVHDISPYALDLRGVKFASLNPLKLSTEREPLLTRTGPFQPFGVANADKTDVELKANGTILRFNPDGSQLELYAWGLRNPYGLAWSPDGRLFAADEGYDERGSRPIANAPDVLWRIEQGAWYGFPDFVAGVPVTDSRFKPQKASAPEFLLKEHRPVPEPFLTFAPHSAITQMDFSRNSAFGLDGQLFVAQVGDFMPITGNEARPVGFQVVRVDPATGYSEVFFKARQDTLGPRNLEHVTTPGPKRPVDVRFARDGNALYIADIGAIMVYPSPTPSAHPFPGSGVIWRVSREGTPPNFPSGLNVALTSTMGETRLTPTGANAGNPAPESVIANWKTGPQQLARNLIAKYGPPQEVTPQRLVWHNNTPWKRTAVLNQEVPHNFPKPHNDMLEQTVALRVAPDMVRELNVFNGSLLVDRTSGEVSSRCDSEEANFAAINLAYDILSHAKSPDEARRDYAETLLQGKNQEYKTKLLFLLPATNQGLADEPYRFR